MATGLRNEARGQLDGVFPMPDTLAATVPPDGLTRDLLSFAAIEDVFDREVPETFDSIFVEPVQSRRALWCRPTTTGRSCGLAATGGPAAMTVVAPAGCFQS